MSTIASLVGSGAGVVAIAVAMIIGMHYHRLPRMAHPWIERFVIVLMYAGGSAIAVTPARHMGPGSRGDRGRMVRRPERGHPAHRPGGDRRCSWSPGWCVSLIWAPSTATGVVAAALPLILGLVAGGVLHELYVGTTVPAQAFASSLNAWLGG